MLPTQQDSRLCLLLLLGLLGMVISFHGVPPGLTEAQWFEIQHINMTRPRCDDAMLVVNRYRRHCKNVNTFLHTTFAFVAGVCHTSNVTCRNGSRNCHDSQYPVRVTFCNLTATRPNCTYQQTPSVKFFRVACKNRSPQDNATYPVVPVHLDAIF